MAAAPITVQQRTQLFENSVFTVYSDHVRDEAGAEVRDFLAIVPRHRTAEKLSGVAILPVVDGRCGLICVYRHPLSEFCWEAPRGFIDDGETPEQAAIRELREETALVADEAPVALGIIAPEPGVLDAKVALFAALGCRAAAAGIDAEMGHGQLKFFSPSELRRSLDQSLILDACTLVLVHRYLALPGGGAP